MASAPKSSKALVSLWSPIHWLLGAISYHMPLSRGSGVYTWLLGNRKMSFIKTIFPATKRRKTDTNAFVQPQPPGSKTTPQETASSNLPNAPRELRTHTVTRSPVFDSFCTSSERELRPDMLRMVLIEAEQRVLFDTASIVPVGNRVLPSNAQLSACKKFQFLKRRRDIATISQMLFGAMPTAVGNDSFKIHTIPDDQRLLVSRLFMIPRLSSKDMRVAADSLESSDSESHYITVRSMDSINGLQQKHGCISSTAPPEAFKRIRNASLQLDDETTEEARPFSPPTAFRLSRDRRLQMSHKTSLCEQSPSTRWKSRSRLSSCGSQTDDEHGRQVGLGIMLNSAEKNFLFQHIPLVEAEMSRLEMRITNAAACSATFFVNVYKAWQEFCKSVCQLHNTPRLRHPVWLSLLERDHNENVVVADFCRQLTRLVEKLDTKHTKFFLSNVISTVLMHHMSWVASVAPPLHAPTHIQERNPLVGSNHNDEAHCMPYNAQIAQYLEISGSVGSAHRMAKTVVTGTDTDLITCILQVLSYFVRCSAIHEKEDERCYQLPIAQSFSPCAAATPESLASPSSECPLDVIGSPTKGVDDDVLSSCSLESLPSVIGNRSREAHNNSTSNDIFATMTPADGLGRSLLAGPSSEYSSHFVLSGLVGSPTDINEAFVKMIDDVRCEDTACHRAAALSLSSSMSSSSVCGDAAQIPDNVIILADTQTWSVQVASNEGWGEVVSPSEAIVSMLEQFCDLYHVGYAPRLLISYLEDSLSDVLGKSLSLVEIVSRDSPSSESPLSPERVRSIVDCDHSDLRLILNVASVYYPPVLASVV
ncbi:unnamed protein product [Cylicocyclus nassatus]|uniref:UDENN FNIP1/2-type domain-containing protein n=1 Tax=Cylicocyclus nassatus TaxID=53992 RepID=A0AA36H0G5_CYLNA|nr:unnamed protein product [Cylicocyclus nassatus]